MIHRKYFLLHQQDGGCLLYDECFVKKGNLIILVAKQTNKIEWISVSYLFIGTIIWDSSF